MPQSPHHHALTLGSQEHESKHGLLLPVVGLWDYRTKDKVATRRFRFFQQERKMVERLDFGPGGAVGVGCGAGVGVAVTGGVGVWTQPWNALRLVFGLGVGCGIGIGYGFGHGIGVRWDRSQIKKHDKKRIVLEI
ncbi:hypothetical protein O6H91_18G060100 [Diphasiastrum complanatum]|uniref:Uncharacterized protein n=2 Tax=Diphasiastrum complanatum TaxID=34168 RepID=A0ACC2B1V7_DIPCM|nr:hypothetical protein O6H91_18G060100 [Diphasiastrum complanatum]KAJ7523722.1 hypothetical protein O6H91_18G060100 [Diphasiastrum complanatum]